MRKRKWWLAGLALALLAACVGVWKWSERPPYSFMGDSQLWYVGGLPHKPGFVMVEYTTQASIETLVRRAKEEVPRTWEETRASGKVTGAYTVWPDGELSLSDRMDNLARAKTGRYPPIRREVTAVISVVRKPTILDRMRKWLYGLQWKGMNP